MNQRQETCNRVENFENLEPQESIEQIESNEVIQEIQNSTNFEVEETQASIEEREISTEEVWGEISGKTIEGKNINTNVTIQNLLKSTLEELRREKIIETEKPLREYLNKMFKIEGKDIEIKTIS